MSQHVVPLLTSWDSFYVIVGTAAATLTGLVFIVITLSSNIRNQSGAGTVQATFNTPSVVHFCAALFIAVLFSAPWTGLEVPALLLGIVGISGTIYTYIIFRRFTHLDSYKPVLEDWAWHVILPFTCYIILSISAVLLLSNAAPAMFLIGAITIIFLFAGIHNAWDNVTYITTMLPQDHVGGSM